MEAPDETLEFVRTGHAALLQVVRFSDDSAGDAFSTFRKGVVRADSSHNPALLQLLQELTQKPKVLTILAEFAQSRRPHRRQIGNVVSILLKEGSWREAAEGCDFVSKLPDDMRQETFDQLRGCKADGKPVPTKRPDTPETPGSEASKESKESKGSSEALRLVQEAMDTLRRLDFELLSGEKEPEAKASLQQMAQGLSLLVQFRREELQAVARMEPKLSFLRFLHMAYERFQSRRELVLQLLRYFLETKELSPWREAAESDHELVSCLGNLGPLGPSSLSPSSRASFESADEDLPASSHAHARWMWQDAGRGYGGPVGAGLARLNPARWSQLLPLDRVVDDLCQHLGTISEERPVRLEVVDDGRKTKIEAANVREALSKLQDHEGLA